MSITPSELDRAREMRLEGVPVSWIQEEFGMTQGEAKKLLPTNLEARKDWSKVWSSIRANKKLHDLHKEFAPRKPPHIK